MTIMRGPWSRSQAQWGQRKRRRVQRAAFPAARRARWRSLRAHLCAMALAALALGAGYLALNMLSPWPPLVTIRHVVAAPNSDAARLTALAPARRGEPGYWPQHDADNDGIACEPWPRLDWQSWRNGDRAR